MKINLVFVFLTLNFFSAYSQGEANIWYFGNRAGLDFNSGIPVALTDGELVTGEGCATISNASGQLLFYTDGITVWDRNHTIMPNGTGLTGHPSSTQSGIIVPKPGDPNIYYVFTTDIRNGPGGLRYTEIDLTLNGGNGDVTGIKNVLLNFPNTEKVTAVRHCNAIDYWVISHGLDNNSFLAYEVTDLGVNTTPVISNVGTVHDEPYGCLKASPDGERIAIAKTTINGNGFAELLDFDTQTGIVSNPIHLDVFTNDFGGAYGIEFSPNGELLYISDLNVLSTPSRIHQFDITLNTQIDIINSDSIIHQQNEQLGTLQLGPDQRIYIAESNSPELDLIENPNTIGLGATYNDNAISLGTANSFFGLPTFIQSTFNTPDTIITADTCIGNATSFALDSTNNISSYFWDFGDGNTSDSVTPTHVYGDTGTYTVTLLTTDNSCFGSQSYSEEITVHESPAINPLEDVVLCNVIGSVIDLSQFNSSAYNTSAFPNYTVTYHASASDAENNINPLAINYTLISNPQTIYVRLENNAFSSCYDSTEFEVTAYEHCIIPQGISPNDDDINDFFDIIWLQAIHIKIFNRYGVEVYEADNYRKEWNGQTNDGEKLPTGTYFYVITDPNDKKYTGWVYVNRPN
ncbi:MAG: gliding motility-associated C-terminal domain-containing protein [Flavobacteriaceae bacterium]|nr:gliding motility-associated C-terminal domain-containing protein [Flavobacteriaceae bacterium]